MILLDTVVLIRVMEDLPLSAAARAAITFESRRGGVGVSAVTGWEIGNLGLTGRTGPRLQPDSRAWFARAVSAPGVRLLPLDPMAAVEAAYLPDPFHKDPADRLLVAVARAERVPIVTSDRRILAYAAAGHVEAIAA